MRVDKVLGFFDLPADKLPTMISMYFSDVDDVGHDSVPMLKKQNTRCGASTGKLVGSSTV
jgi:hypothetical protein